MPLNSTQMSAFLAHQLKSAVVNASAHHAAADMQQAKAANRQSTEQTAAMALAAMKHHLPPGATPEQARSVAVHAAADTAVSEVKTIYSELIAIQSRLQQNNSMQTQKLQQMPAQRSAAQMAMQLATQRSAAQEAMNKKLDSMSDASEMESLRLQMAMDRLSKMMELLSSLLKKSADVSNGIARSLR